VNTILSEIEEGEIIGIKAPYVIEYGNIRHGMRLIPGDYCPPDSFGRGFFVADGEGEMQIKIIRIVDMPKGYRRRFFFRRSFIVSGEEPSNWLPMECKGEVALRRYIGGKKWNYKISSEGRKDLWS